MREESIEDRVDGASEPTGRILVARMERSSSVAAYHVSFENGAYPRTLTTAYLL